MFTQSSHISHANHALFFPPSFKTSDHSEIFLDFFIKKMGLVADDDDASFIRNKHSDPPRSDAATDQLKNWGLPLRNQDFVGRGNLLNQLQEQFFASDQARIVIVSSANVNGMGKTELVLEWVWRQMERLPGVVWFNVEDEESLLHAYADLADILLPLETEKAFTLYEKAYHVRTCLEERLVAGWAIIYDGVTSYDTVQAMSLWLPQTAITAATGKIIFTTKMDRRWENPLIVGGFTRKESCQFIQKKLTHLFPSLKVKANAVNNLAEKLRDFPLTLNYACAYIQAERLLISDYLNLYETTKQQLLQNTILPKLEIALNTLQIVLSIVKIITFDRIQQIEPLATKWLIFQSYIGSVTPKFLFDHFVDGYKVRALFKKNLSALLKTTLYKYAVIHLDWQGNLVLHSALQKIILEHATKVLRPLINEEQTLFDVAALLKKSLSLTDSLAINVERKNSILLPHLLKIIKQLERLVQNSLSPINNSLLIPMLRDMLSAAAASYYRNLNDLNRAKQLCEQIYAIEKTHYGDHAILLLSNLGSLGAIYDEMGEFYLAEKYLKKALMLLQNKPKMQITQAMYLTCLGFVMRLQDNFVLAQDFFLKSLDLLEKNLVLSEDKSDQRLLGATLEKLGIIYLDTQDYLTAENFFKRSIAVFEKSDGLLSITVANKLGHLIDLALHMRQWQAGKKRVDKALNIYNKHYGTNHIALVPSLERLACIHFFQKDYSEAVNLLERSLRIQEDFYGDNKPPSIALNLHRLVLVYHALGDQKSGEYLQAANRIQQPHYGLSQLGLSHALEAKNYFEQLLLWESPYYPENHPALALSYLYLGNAHRLLDHVPKAQRLWEQGLAIFKQYYGIDNIYTASFLTNLADIYVDMAEETQAKELYKQAVDIQRQHFGGQSLRYAEGLETLGNAYYLFGNAAKALSYYQSVQAIQDLPANQVQYAISLAQIGKAYLFSEKEKARDYLETSIQEQIRLKQQTAPCFIDSWLSLSQVYIESSDYAKAQEWLQFALYIAEKHYGSEHIKIAELLLQLGHVARLLKQFPLAESLLNRAQSIRERQRGEKDLSIGIIIEELANVYWDANNKEKAIIHYKKVEVILAAVLEQAQRHQGKLKIFFPALLRIQATFKENNPRIEGFIDKLIDVSEAFKAGQNFVLAKFFYKLVSSLQLSFNLQHSKKGALTQHKLASIYHKLHYWGKAKQHYEQAEQLVVELFNNEAMHTAVFFKDYANFYLDTKEIIKAKVLFEKVLAIQQKLNAASPHIANTLNDLGICHRTLKELYQAKLCYEKALWIEKNHYGEIHTAVARTFINLANVYYDLNQLPQAESFLKQGLMIHKTFYQPLHPHIITTLQNLSYVYQALNNFLQEKTILEELLVNLESDKKNYAAKIKLTLKRLGNISLLLGDNDQARQYFEKSKQLSAIEARENNDLATHQAEQLPDAIEPPVITIESQTRQQKSYFQFSQFMAQHYPHIKFQSVRQGLYMPVFEKKRHKVQGLCAAITRGVSQSLFLDNTGKSVRTFLANLHITTEIYERIIQGKAISIRENEEINNLSRLMQQFLQSIQHADRSLPTTYSQITQFSSLSNLLSVLSMTNHDVAWHILVEKHVVALYRQNGHYTYFDSNLVFIDSMHSLNDVLAILKKSWFITGYKEEALRVEVLNVDAANRALTQENRQILQKTIVTERILLKEQDQLNGLLQLPDQQFISRETLYDLGAKVYDKEVTGILLDASMQFNSQALQRAIQEKKLSIKASAILEKLTQNNVLVSDLLSLNIPVEGTKREINLINQLKHKITQPSSTYFDWIHAAGSFSFIRGVHGTAASYYYGDITGFNLGVGEIGLSFLPIEKWLASTRFFIRRPHLAHGTAGALTSPFDMYDFVCALIEASHAKSGSKTLQDSLVNAFFSGSAVISGIVFPVLGKTSAGTIVGLAITLAQGTYQGIQTIEQYTPYNLTAWENWEIFWNSFFFQHPPEGIQKFQSRQDCLKEFAATMQSALHANKDIGAFVMGLGQIIFTDISPQTTFAPRTFAKTYYASQIADPLLGPLDLSIIDDAQWQHRRPKINLIASHSTILMDFSFLKGDQYAKFLSRSQPPTANDGFHWSCLPFVSNEAYEHDRNFFGQPQSLLRSANVSNYCDNAMVLTRDDAENQVSPHMFYDLKWVKQGLILGKSGKWGNYFRLYAGSAKIFGGNHTSNYFFLSQPYQGTLIGGINAVNTLDSSYVNRTTIINSQWLMPFNREDYVKHLLYPSQINIEKMPSFFNQTVYGMNQFILSAYSLIRGEIPPGAEFIVKPRPGNARIEVTSVQASLIHFPTVELLRDGQFYYDNEQQTLNITISQSHKNFTFSIKNWPLQAKNFSISDQLSSIHPVLAHANDGVHAITNFYLRMESKKSDTEASAWYKQFLSQIKTGYQVFTEIILSSYLHVKEQYADLPKLFFGTHYSDIFPIGRATFFMQGGEGEDLYQFEKRNRGEVATTVTINNAANDRKNDILYFPSNHLIQVTQHDNNLYVFITFFDSSQNKSRLEYDCLVENYFLSEHYQHLQIMNEQSELFVVWPVNEKIKLLPYFFSQKNQSFVLSHATAMRYGGAVINFPLDSLQFLREKQDLILFIDKTFSLILESFYEMPLSKEFILYGQAKEQLSIAQLKEFAKLTIPYQTAIQDRDVKKTLTYAFFDEPQYIFHNQAFINDSFITVPCDQQREAELVIYEIDPVNLQVNKDEEEGLQFTLQNVNHTRQFLFFNNWFHSAHQLSSIRFSFSDDSIIASGKLEYLADLQEAIDFAACLYRIKQLFNSWDDSKQQRLKELRYRLVLEAEEKGISAYVTAGFTTEFLQPKFIETYSPDGKLEKSAFLSDQFSHAVWHWLLLESYYQGRLIGHTDKQIKKCLTHCFQLGLSEQTLQDLFGLIPSISPENLLTKVIQFIGETAAKKSSTYKQQPDFEKQFDAQNIRILNEIDANKQKLTLFKPPLLKHKKPSMQFPIALVKRDIHAEKISSSFSEPQAAPITIAKLANFKPLLTVSHQALPLFIKSEKNAVNKNLFFLDYILRRIPSVAKPSKKISLTPSPMYFSNAKNLNKYQRLFQTSQEIFSTTHKY